jgi:pyruvate,water dikinase
LAEKSVILDSGDVFFLFLDELGRDSVDSSALVDGLQEKADRRKKAFSQVCAANEKGVHWMESTGSLAVAAEGPQKHNGALDGQGTFHGVSASRGSYEGNACIIHSPDEFGKLKEGDIMVSTRTSPAWTPLFKVAGAVVTEVGSPTSHAAIVAREYGIPCIVAVPGITSLLKDGQRIIVDGSTGTIWTSQ